MIYDIELFNWLNTLKSVHVCSQCYDPKNAKP